MTISIIDLIKTYKSISDDMLMIIMNLNDENSEKLLNEIIINLNPLNYYPIKWKWFDKYLSSSILFKRINKENKLIYEMIEEIASSYDKEILSNMMKEDIIESKILEEKEVFIVDE